jgi:acyl-CoA reductase-like NAD-dependent aldehyde dehydrogenase
MGHERAFDAVKSDITKAVQKGAEIIHGEIGYDMQDSQFQNGFWQQPVVLENIEFGSEMYLHEFYGPVFCLYRVHNLQEALTYANKSDHGKSATVFSASEYNCKTLAQNLRVGLVHINNAPVTSTSFPVAGIKGSGFGSNNSSSQDGLMNLVNRKLIVNN